MKTISLNGEWKLLYADQQVNPEGREGMAEVAAQVPGNVEIDLMAAGALPDIFFGNNVKLLKPYEFYRWRYERTFIAPEVKEGERVFLNFRGVDCIARYELNGVWFAESDNALIEQRFEVTNLLKEGENELCVELRSPMLAALDVDYEARCRAQPANYESIGIRKSPACYGWDIMPRTLSAGLWRDVLIEIEGEDEIDEIYFTTHSITKKNARIICHFRTHSSAPYFQGLKLRITGSLKGKEAFVVEKKMQFVSGRFDFNIDRPALWMPRGYGDANVYDMKVELLRDGVVVSEHNTSMGVRTVKLVRTETVDANGGEFHFEINGVKVFCMGSNWVPADALHSRDAGRYEKMLDMWRDTNSNILRCWGGNVYEDHRFFDICDREGIMVWHDFSMACATYPMNEEFMATIRAEAESVVKKLRNHPSIVLWSGDNEVDQGEFFGANVNPGDNRITREVIPQVIARHDPYRPYMPSSPYIAPAVWEAHNPALLPEDHLWGPRDYYKGKFYTTSPAKFVSETGYHGCNSLSSIRNFISEDKLWPWQDNDEWLTHAAEMDGPEGPYAYRIKLMADQIHEMFGIDPDNLEDFILASQISQAEAKKFFIELTRTSRWQRTGVIWWNMIDGWPQFSDAVVSYDFIKKLAYHYIKRSQQQLCLMCREPDGWGVDLVADNVSLEPRKGSCCVRDFDTGEILFEDAFDVAANSNETLGKIRVSHGDHKLLLIEWESGGIKGVNHYLLGKPPFSLEKYKEYLNAIAGLDGSFDAAQVGK